MHVQCSFCACLVDSKHGVYCQLCGRKLSVDSEPLNERLQSQDLRGQAVANALARDHVPTTAGKTQRHDGVGAWTSGFLTTPIFYACRPVTAAADGHIAMVGDMAAIHVKTSTSWKTEWQKHGVIDDEILYTDLERWARRGKTRDANDRSLMAFLSKSE